MKFYNKVMCHLSIIFLFSSFTGVVASQAQPVQDPKLPESVCQMKKETEVGTTMLGDDYTKSASLEIFRRDKVEKQQKHEQERLKQERLDAERLQQIAKIVASSKNNETLQAENSHKVKN